MDIQWKDEYALGIGIIDDQPKNLIERTASFSRAVERAERRPVNRGEGGVGTSLSAS